MGRFGRTIPQRSVVYGIPPTEQPGAAPPTAPIAGGIQVTGGGRHARATTTRPLVAWSPRPLASIGVTYTDSGAVTVTITPAGADRLGHTGNGQVTILLAPSGDSAHTYTDAAAVGVLLALTGSDSYETAMAARLVAVAIADAARTSLHHTTSSRTR